VQPVIIGLVDAEPIYAYNANYDTCASFYTPFLPLHGNIRDILKETLLRNIGKKVLQISSRGRGSALPARPFIPRRPQLLLVQSPHHLVRLDLAPAFLPEQHCLRHHLRHRVFGHDLLQVVVGTEVRQGSDCFEG
jgi:hypothetical protein